MEGCRDHNCPITRATGVDPNLPGNEDWVQKVIAIKNGRCPQKLVAVNDTATDPD